MVNVLPYRLNFGPNAVLNGQPTDLSVYCGMDWSITVPFTGTDGTTPINLASPLMDVRAVADSTSLLILSPTLTVAANTVTIKIPGSVSKLVTAKSGAYDLHATRTDTGAPIWLLAGYVTFVQSTTVLP